ncbi:hypothetical protein [Novacetimonas pomaceti]|uniref:O-antigen ligase domain-containing protein n=1 Tax=Novacetimonas pomaceti TaxID=2021998 RepID=A0ABX5P3W0_9PROT|nr:hypothetical protein [Novacetimonas pomaceti]PYD48465.1 hypothetical protein C3920_04560 [Novacetimonas pomaceti]
MTIPLVGIILFPLCLLLWMRPIWMLHILLLAGVLPASAALILGGLGVQPAMVPAMAFMSFVLLQWIMGVHYPGERTVMTLCLPFILVVGWTLLASIIMPRLFMNQVMVWPQKSDSVGGRVLLAPNFGNISQDMYLVINAVFLVIAARFMTRTDVRLDRLYRTFLLSGWCVVGICMWQFAHRVAGVPFPDTFFYSNPGWAVLNTQMAGPVPRINASFSEPAACAAFLSEILFSSVWIVLQGYSVASAKWLVPASAMALVCTTSTTGFITVAVEICLLPVAALATGAMKLLGNISRLIAVGIALLGIGVLVLVTVAPQVVPAAQFVFQSTAEKKDSQSYQDRSQVDRDSMSLVAETYGLGVGWGSNRASSLLPGLLSTIGLVGVMGLMVFDWKLLRAAMGARKRVSPGPERLVIEGVIPALVARLIAASLSSPTVGFLDFYLLIAMLIAAIARIDLLCMAARASRPAQLALPDMYAQVARGHAMTETDRPQIHA